MDLPEPVVAPDEAPPSAPEAPVVAPPAQLAIERLEDGSLRIAAPPELAAPMAALFEQLARGLRTAAGPGAPAS